LNVAAKYGDCAQKVVYIGDSGTDIECLTENGTVGIAMSADTNSSLIETLNRVGIDVKHISAYKKMRKSAVYQAQDFKEILESSLFMSE
jgi:hypothetical protein